MTNEPSQPNAVMLASVGGSTAPVIKSIQESRPAKIIFFVSAESYALVTREILPAVMPVLGGIPPHEIIKTPDEQDLGQSTFVLLREVPAAMHKLGESDEWPSLVDFTGGTKVMSAALVWAASRFACQFSYVGADSPDARNKGGLGIVIDGKERCLLRENPWNEIAWFAVQDATALFNAGQYANAAALLNKICSQVTTSTARRTLELIQQLWEGYAAWDVFEHRRAIQYFSKSVQPLCDSAPREETLWPGLMAFAEGSAECYELLQGIQRNGQDLSTELIHDLVANAMRRLKIEHKNDDATARLYSAIEKLAKHALKRRHDINNSACRPEQLPDALQADYTRRFLNEKKGTLAFGLEASYALLTALQDPLAEKYADCRAELEKLLPLRNNSILGHGSTPISRENAERLLAVALQLLGVQEAELTNFPQMGN